MKSATRSGRIYSLNEAKNKCSFTTSKQETTPQKRKEKVNIITPDLDQNKTQQILCNKSPVRKDIDKQPFYSIYESEEKYEFPMFLGQVNPFDYDSDSPTKTPQQKEKFLPSPCSKRAHERMDTVAIHPMVPRNYYGGIRDCLPPIRIQSAFNVNVIQRKALSVQQLETIEENRLVVLSKLRENR